MSDGRWGGFSGGSGASSLGQNIDFDFGFLVQHLRPPAGWLRKDLEAGKRSDTHKFIDEVSGQNNIDVLREPSDKAVMPHGPSARQSRLTANEPKKVVNRFHHPPIAAGKVLRLEH